MSRGLGNKFSQIQTNKDVENVRVTYRQQIFQASLRSRRREAAVRQNHQYFRSAQNASKSFNACEVSVSGRPSNDFNAFDL